MRYFYPKGGGSNKFRVPDNYLQRFASFDNNNLAQWICCKFSIHPNEEHVLVFGDQEGYVTFCDARFAYDDEKFSEISVTFKADNCLISDISYIPTRPDNLITISASSAVQIWDTNLNTSIYCLGHEEGVRSLAVWDHNPDSFVTGSKEGNILVWDTRQPIQLRTTNKNFATVSKSITPNRTYNNAHSNLDFKNSPGKNAQTDIFQIITNVVSFNQNYFLSSSNYSNSGIRMWDIRYHTKKPIQIFDVPQKTNRKKSGISSMCFDRFSSSLFAACTDNNIYEYMPSLNSVFPVNRYKGAIINSSYIRCKTSPISDHLLCGSNKGCAVLWDLQEHNVYNQNDRFEEKLEIPKYLPGPKFEFSGHTSEVTCVEWSTNGRYIATLDDFKFRVWDSELVPDDFQTNKNKKTINGIPRTLFYPESCEPKYFNSQNSNLSSSCSSKNSIIKSNQINKENILNGEKPKKLVSLENLPTVYLNNYYNNNKKDFPNSNITNSPTRNINKIEKDLTLKRIIRRPVQMLTPKKPKEIILNRSGTKRSATKEKLNRTPTTTKRAPINNAFPEFLLSPEKKTPLRDTTILDYFSSNNS